MVNKKTFLFFMLGVLSSRAFLVPDLMDAVTLWACFGLGAYALFFSVPLQSLRQWRLELGWFNSIVLSGVAFYFLFTGVSSLVVAYLGQGLMASFLLLPLLSEKPLSSPPPNLGSHPSEA